MLSSRSKMERASLLPVSKFILAINSKLCALLSAVKRFDSYLEFTKFVVTTNTTALERLVTMRCGESILSRWHQILTSYDFTEEHILVKANAFADALSRTPALYNESKVQPDVM